MEPVNYRVKSAEYLGDYNVGLEFFDGTKGRVDLSNNLNIGALKELQNKNLFSQLEVHPVFKTLCWPNGADFAPEFLRENLQC